MKKSFVLLFMIITPFLMFSQDLDEFFSSSEDKDKEPVSVTFLGERIGNGPSVEVPGKNELNLIISHRFGRIDGGFYELFGLDDATMRMGFDYGITDRFAVGIGRSSLLKTFDFYLKYKILNQAKNGSPISLALYSSLNHISQLRYFQGDNDNFIDRSGMSLLLPIARKFGDFMALQITPAWQRNIYVPELGEGTDIYALGAGLRVKLSHRVHFTGEYFHLLKTPYSERYSPLTLGFDLDTGGHLFQLVFSNSQGMTEKTYLADTRGKWQDKEIYFGFNLIRVFYLNN